VGINATNEISNQTPNAKQLPPWGIEGAIKQLL